MTNRDLPRVFILELACDACDRRDEMIVAPDLDRAWQEAQRLGWTVSGKLHICPKCRERLSPSTHTPQQ